MKEIDNDKSDAESYSSDWAKEISRQLSVDASKDTLGNKKDLKAAQDKEDRVKEIGKELRKEEEYYSEREDRRNRTNEREIRSRSRRSKSRCSNVERRSRSRRSRSRCSNVDSEEQETRKKKMKGMKKLRSWFGDEDTSENESTDDSEDWRQVDSVKKSKERAKKQRKTKQLREEQTLEKASHIKGLGPIRNDVM